MRQTQEVTLRVFHSSRLDVFPLSAAFFIALAEDWDTACFGDG